MENQEKVCVCLIVNGEKNEKKEVRGFKIYDGDDGAWWYNIMELMIDRKSVV